MAYTVTPGAHPDLYILTYTGDLGAEELLIENELHLNENRFIYILADVSGMNNGLPDGFLETVQRSFVLHPHTAHIAVYVTSAILRIAASMVVKVTRQKKKISLHDSYKDAYERLEKVIKEQIPKVSQADYK